jgi:hypothetical protein
MAKKPDLIPVFIPPLAALLADAESKKGTRLTESEKGYEEDDFFFNPFGRWRFAAMVR